MQDPTGGARSRPNRNTIGDPRLDALVRQLVAEIATEKPPELIEEMIVTALNSLGVPVLGAKGGERSGSPHQSVDIGTGWVASVDLPAGATPERITGRPRSRPGSGGRSVRLARHRP